MKSRELYIDCVKAKEMFEKSVQQKKLTEAKILWFACLSMLRAIGKVLQEVDSKNRSVLFSEKLASKWKEWKTDEIFSSFIKPERDLLLKEYESSLGETIKNETFNIVHNGPTVTHKGSPVIHTSTVTELVKQHGVFPNQSPILVLNNALEWWDKQLSELEQTT